MQKVEIPNIGIPIFFCYLFVVSENYYPILQGHLMCIIYELYGMELAALKCAMVCH